MKVLVLSKYDRLAASTRHRFLQYGPYLATHGIDLVVSPLFDDAYLKTRFQSGRAAPSAVARGYLRRLAALLGARRYDAAIVHYELFPYLPGLAEQALSVSRLPYVCDYDDATFHMYDEHRWRWVRRLLGRKLVPIIRGAAAVMAGNAYLAQYARRFNDNVHIVPTVVDMQRYPAKVPDGAFSATAAEPATGRRLTIGWIGSPSTTAYLELIAPALAQLAREGPLRLVATGARPLDMPGIDVEIRPWSEDREVQDLHEADVGIMPMPDEPWARGKCAFKLIQYMAAGLPTVASPVGANAEVVTDETGLFASTTEEWIATLRRLRDDPALRQRLGAAGRTRAEARFSLQSQQETVRSILSGLA